MKERKNFFNKIYLKIFKIKPSKYLMMYEGISFSCLNVIFANKYI